MPKQPAVQKASKTKTKPDPAPKKELQCMCPLSSCPRHRHPDDESSGCDNDDEWDERAGPGVGGEAHGS